MKSSPLPCVASLKAIDSVTSGNGISGLGGCQDGVAANPEERSNQALGLLLADRGGDDAGKTTPVTP